MKMKVKHLDNSLYEKMLRVTSEDELISFAEESLQNENYNEMGVIDCKSDDIKENLKYVHKLTSNIDKHWFEGKYRNTYIGDIISNIKDNYVILPIGYKLLQFKNKEK